MSEPINMTQINQMRNATREVQAAAKQMAAMLARMEAMQAELLAALEKRGPGRPRKDEAA